MIHCIDCRYYEAPYCKASPKPNYIEDKPIYWYAASVREHAVLGDCGPEGVKFAPKLVEVA